jgi:hypothetical protein
MPRDSASPRRRRTRSRTPPRRSHSRRSRRSRSRTHSRSRSRSRSERLSRSTSRELYREPAAAVVPVPAIQRVVEKQQEYILDLISEHKQEVEEKFQQRARRFSSKQIEKQFQVNTQFKETVAKIQAALAAKDTGKAQEATNSLAEQLEEHEQDLIIADTSPHGWLAVSKLRTTKDLPKAVRKRLAAVERDLAQQKTKKYGGPGKKFGGFQAKSSESDAKKPERRFSPEEALFAAAKQVRPGLCSHCNKQFHYYRECPEFWTKVNQSRAAKAKGSGQDD